MKIQHTIETNVGLAYRHCNCEITEFYKVGDYVATFYEKDYNYDYLYKKGTYVDLIKTNCVKAKVIELSEPFILCDGKIRNNYQYDRLTLEFENGETITISPKWALLIGKLL